MKPEYIIIIIFGLLAVYIIVESLINSSKVKKSKTDAKKPDDKGKKASDVVELKSVITPRIDGEAVERKSNEDALKEAAAESIQLEKEWKDSLLKEEQVAAQKIEEKNKQEELEKKVAEMRRRLDAIELSDEEETFVDEVSMLSPELKAILFADLLKRKDY
ncbi:MAG: hypothetical protein AB7S44_02350 [Spirochaetales bacterium]